MRWQKILNRWHWIYNFYCDLSIKITNNGLMRRRILQHIPWFWASCVIQKLLLAKNADLCDFPFCLHVFLLAAKRQERVTTFSTCTADIFFIANQWTVRTQRCRPDAVLWFQIIYRSYPKLTCIWRFARVEIQNLESVWHNLAATAADLDHKM